MNDFAHSITAIIASIIGLAIVAVIVSKNSQTSSVVQAGGSALSSLIQAAVQPVSSTNNGILA